MEPPRKQRLLVWMLHKREGAAFTEEDVWDVYPLSSGQEESSEWAEVRQHGCALRAMACPGELGTRLRLHLNGQRKNTVDVNGDFNLR